MTRLVIVGGSDAGISAGLRARPPITGLDQLGPDTFALTEALDREPRSAVIVGAALAVLG
jgi:hypothetical protein